MEFKPDPAVQRRRLDEEAARRAAGTARGLFLAADEIGRIKYHLDRIERAVVDDWELRGVADRILDDYGAERIEIRVVAPTADSYPAGEHPATSCSRCGHASVEFGNAYHECRSCGHAFLLVAPDH